MEEAINKSKFIESLRIGDRNNVGNVIDCLKSNIPSPAKLYVVGSSLISPSYDDIDLIVDAPYTKYSFGNFLKTLNKIQTLPNFKVMKCLNFEKMREEISSVYGEDHVIIKEDLKKHLCTFRNGSKMIEGGRLYFKIEGELDSTCINQTEIDLIYTNYSKEHLRGPLYREII